MKLHNITINTTRHARVLPVLTNVNSSLPYGRKVFRPDVWWHLGMPFSNSNAQWVNSPKNKNMHAKLNTCAEIRTSLRNSYSMVQTPPKTPACTAEFHLLWSLVSWGRTQVRHDWPDTHTIYIYIHTYTHTYIHTRFRVTRFPKSQESRIQLDWSDQKPDHGFPHQLRIHAGLPWRMQGATGDKGGVPKV